MGSIGSVTSVFTQSTRAFVNSASSSAIVHLRRFTNSFPAIQEVFSNVIRSVISRLSGFVLVSFSPRHTLHGIPFSHMFFVTMLFQLRRRLRTVSSVYGRFISTSRLPVRVLFPLIRPKWIRRVNSRPSRPVYLH